MDVPSVPVGPFNVADLSQPSLVEALVQRTRTGGVGPLVAYALHVGGLNHRDEKSFVAAMRAANVVYADGMSIVALARMAGATRVQRAPTTDVGWEVLVALGLSLSRRPRIALIGGPDGLARRAAERLEAAAVGRVVLAEHGYHKEWGPVLAAVRGSDPDVVVVGLGAPREMIWVMQHRDDLPETLVLTCGGWFGFLAGDEKRASSLLQAVGLEWMARVAQSPRRLLPRYVRGAAAVGALVPSALNSRWRGAGG